MGQIIRSKGSTAFSVASVMANLERIIAAIKEKCFFAAINNTKKMEKQSLLRKEKQQSSLLHWTRTVCSGILMASFVIGTSFIVTSCNDDDDEFETDESSLMVNNEVGYVRFDKSYKKWYIEVIPEGTIDSFKIYYVDEMPKDYREAGMLVMFSGNCHTIHKGFEDYPAGYEFFSLRLSQIIQTAVCDFDEKNQPSE